MTNNPGFILNLATLAANLFACLISFIISIIIIHHIYHNRLKQEDRAVVSVYGMNYLLILATTTIGVSLNIQTLLGDLYEQDANSSGCIFIRYLSYVLFGALYWNFVNQAFLSLCRIVYSTYRWLQYWWLYVILFPIELILICIFLCPLLVWHDIVYLPKEYYCAVRFTNVRGNLWFISNDYGIPLLLLSLIYLRITKFLRQQSNNRAHIVKQRQQRDLLVIRRILIIVGSLIALGVPTIVLLIIFYITGTKEPFAERIMWLSISLSMLELSLSLVILIPQLKLIVLKKFQRDRVTPFDGSLVSTIPMRHNTTIL